ncbi:MAG: BA14K family protein [Methyloceanibacter sp.]
MTRTNLRALTVAALIGLGALSLSATAQAGYWGGHGYWGGGPGYWGAGLVGLGVGAAIGSALAAPVYVGPPYAGPPPPPAVAYNPAGYGPGAYGPPAWTPEWYTYCAQRYRSFNSHTGYFTGHDGQPYFCQ